MLTDTWRAVTAEYSGLRARANTHRIHISDVRSEYGAFAETADWCKRAMAEAGLTDIAVHYHVTDGETKLFDYTPPRSWHAKEARLDLVTPSRRRLAEYPANPASLAMYSAPTPTPGVQARLVDAETMPDGADLSGCLVLSSRLGHDLEERVFRAGGMGLVFDHVSSASVPGRRMQEPGATYWANSCFIPDNPNGLFAFVVSPTEGDALRELLRRPHGEVTVEAVVRSSLRAGTLPTVTGIIPGTDPEAGEVMAFSHLFEIGANDNASGCGADIESARTLSALIARGDLSPPRRTIRFALGAEMFGLLSLIASRNGHTRDILAAMNLDMVGEDENRCGGSLGLYRSSVYNPSFISDLLAFLYERAAEKGGFRWREVEQDFWIGDDFIADPMIGIPCAALYHSPDRFYHSNQDTVDRVSSESLGRTGSISTAALYFAAAAGLREAEWTGKLVVHRAMKRLLDFGDGILATHERAGGNADLGLAHRQDVDLATIQSVARLGSCLSEADQRELARSLEDGCGEHGKAVELLRGRLQLPRVEPTTPVDWGPGAAADSIPHRVFYGPLCSWTVDRETQRSIERVRTEAPGFPRDHALCLADGTRDLRHIHAKLRQRFPEVTVNSVRQGFALLATLGIVRLTPAL